MRFRAALVFFTLGGFALRTYGLHHQSFWLDEVDAITFAGEPVAAQLPKLVRIGENGPLYFLVFKGWLALSGTSEFGARFLSAMVSSVAIPLLGALTYRLFRHVPTALIATVLAAASPYYVWYAQDAKMYPLYAALALAAQYCFVRGWGGPNPLA
ncbi:MAG: glycosyltransferase family 39 protein, partial [Chloroflexota bacterium]